MINEIEKKLWERVDKYVPRLQWVPFLKLVAVCNNLAFGSVKEGSDIDLFVIAKTGRLFTARFLITVFFHFLGVRRHSKMVSGRFCLSFFVDNSYLNLSTIAKRDDYYLAYWIKNITPVIDSGISDQFLLVNDWIKPFFEKDEKIELSYSRKIPYKITGFGRFLEFCLNGKIGDFLEYVLRKWQISRARKKTLAIKDSSGLLVEEHILKFHNIDRREEYRDAWIKKYGSDSKLTKEKFIGLF